MARIDQGMAAAAAAALPGQVDKELRTRYRQLRVMLHTAGLAATYAFIASKAKDPDEGSGAADKARLAAAYQDAAKGIVSRLFPANAEHMSARDVLRELGCMDPVRYARASAEASAFAGWLSRLADAVYQEGEDDA
ncbi:MAG TPA: type III-B CRISPR module-associated protein Cmr5 [Streptosporangiaceae bacterium]|nr:type III-B CRISPR module-associated protein Cmr5 [Streptosporangiaceae bacterium]